MITKYFEVKKLLLKDIEGDDEEAGIDYENLKILDMLKEDADLIEENREEFRIKASSLLHAWKTDQTVKMKKEEDAAKEAE